MPLPALKLPAVASMYGGGAKPYHHNFNILVRQMTFSSASATATSSAASSSTTTSSSSSIRPNSSLAWTREWRKTSCAPFPYHRAAHDRNNNKAYYKKLGFRSYCFSSEGRKGGGESRVSLVTEMGPPDRDDRWYDGELSPAAKNHLNEQPPPQQQQQRQHQPQSAKLLTLPTILTIGRVAAVPLFVSTFYVDSWWGPTATTVIFIAAAITDWLDGYLARKMKLGTAFGAFLDPVADKLMVAATLVLLCTRPLEGPMFGQVPWLLTGPAIAIIGREITMSAVREWAAQQSSKLSEAVAVNNLGKWKTASQMTALTILLATRDSSLAGAEALKASGVLLLYISAWLAVWSLFVYIRKIWRVLLM